MAFTDIREACKEVYDRIDSLDDLLGKGLMQPFNNMNSAPRKSMYAVHVTHNYPILNPDVPMISTGHETKYGQASSAFITADSDYELVGKIPKYTYPYLSIASHYYAIFLDKKTNVLTCIDRAIHKNGTESYGFLYNNDYIDNLNVGDSIAEGQVVRKSIAFDEFNNRMDGKNLLTGYFANDETEEDGISISESAAETLASPLIKVIKCNINENDILVNMYGDNNNYKIIPDIGEETKNGIVCAVRQEKKQESLFSQSYDRLSTLLPSDVLYLAKGKILDIEVFCNNPEALVDSPYNQQIKRYYDDSINTKRTIINIIDNIMSSHEGCKMDYELETIYHNAKKELNGGQFINGDKVFSNIQLQITVLEKNPMRAGDKITNRYGGKGVITSILPDDRMPMLDNGERLDVICNYGGVIGRNNSGQMAELEINHIGERIIEYMTSGLLDVYECIDLYKKFIKIINPEYHDFICQTLDGLSEDDLTTYLQVLMDDRGIYVSTDPLNSQMSVFILDQLYKEFPFAKPYSIRVPIRSSTGEYRMVDSRRDIVAGRLYFYRLKQYAEEKFSATSLSAININGENSRNRASKDHKDNISNKTPIKNGEMEQGDLLHVGIAANITAYMIYSGSDQARRDCGDELLTGDTFNIDIKLSDDATNSNAEKVATFFRTIGIELKFVKIKKELEYPFLHNPFRRVLMNPFSIGDKKLSKETVNMKIMSSIKKLETPFDEAPVLKKPDKKELKER